MASHNFMLQDLLGSLRAVAVFPLFLLVPGYVVAWLFNLFQFRGRTLSFRLSLSAPLSISICPILTCLSGRYVSMSAVWALYAALAAGFLILLFHDRRRLSLAGTLPYALILTGWLAICIFTLIDVQIGDRLYFPTNTFDYSTRSAFVHAISVTGVPPQSPFFQPGHPVALRYHYFWPMMCSLVNQVAPAAVSARQALIGGTFWCGVGLLGLAALFPRLFLPDQNPGVRRRTFTAALLLGITGLDIVPSLFFLFLWARGQMGFVLPSGECWNEYVDWFLHTALWAPHALAAAIAGFVCFLLVSHASASSGRQRDALTISDTSPTDGVLIPSRDREGAQKRGALVFGVAADGSSVSRALRSLTVAARIRGTSVREWFTRKGTASLVGYSVIAGAALASAAGLSIWVAFVFGAFFVVWTGVTLCKRWHTETLGLAVAGVTCLILIRPYLHDLQGPGAAAGPLMGFTVRAFSFTALVPVIPGMSQWMRLLLVNGSLLPINYFLEFGLFFLVAKFKWRQYRISGQPVSRADLACAILLATSTLICTFLRSGVIGNNDLGWRGFIPAQFVLLVWAVDIFSQRDELSFLDGLQRQWLVVCLALGFAGSAYDLAITRTYPVLADRGVVPPLDWMAPDRDFGHRVYATRAAYEWLRNVTAPTAAVQANPRVVSQDTIGMLYGDRPTVAADVACLTTFGGDPRECPAVLAPVEAVFPVNAASAPASLQDVCQALPIDSVVAKDTDAVWTNSRSWVWTTRPDFANQYVRVFRCQSLRSPDASAQLHAR